MSEKLLTAAEVAKILRVSTGWVYGHLNKAPIIPSLRIGTAVRFRESSILAFVEALEEEARRRAA